MPRLTKADWQLIREALNYALEDRSSYRDAWRHVRDEEGKQVRADCDDFKNRVEAFSKKHLGKATDYQLKNDRIAASPFVSLSEVGKDLKS